MLNRILWAIRKFFPKAYQAMRREEQKVDVVTAMRAQRQLSPGAPASSIERTPRYSPAVKRGMEDRLIARTAIAKHR